MLNRVDFALGRISMYRLVCLALLVILAAALLLGAAGALSSTPVGILGTAAVAVGGVLLTTWIGGRLTKTSPKLISSVVTGLILGLVLLPDAAGGSLRAAAIAGCVAGASKFVLVWRGRHVLNPAVVGLLVVTWLDAGVAGWWVGSTVLAPVVLPLGLLVLWRTRRFGYGLSYMVPALVLTTVGYLTLGTSFWDALRFAAVASPILFLGMFMLTEPLTTPPRSYQRLMVGGLVAVIGAAPLYLDAGWVSAELALAVGNVVAFALGPRAGVRLRLLRGRRRGEVLDLWFEPSSSLRFAAGQFVEVDVPQALRQRGGRTDPRGRRRVLSVASAPSADEVRLVTRMVPGPGMEPSPVKRAMAELEVGETVSVTLVGGDFLLPTRHSDGRLALIGAGIGVTPFLAHLDAIVRGDVSAPTGGWDIVLVHAVRSFDDVLTLPVSAAELPAGIELVLVAPPEADDVAAAAPAGWRMVGASALDAGVLAEAVPDLATRHVMVSGSPLAVSAVEVAAHQLGAVRVWKDVFLGY